MTVPTTDRALALNRELCEVVKNVQLLGEIHLSNEKLAEATLVLREFTKRHGYALTKQLYPDLLAATITEIAGRNSDGHELWPPIEREIGGTATELRDFYVRYLKARGLPDFEYLVATERAMFYRARVLAHAMIPRPLVPRFMDHVIWPSITEPGVWGATGDDIQQRLVRNPPQQLGDAVRRFATYGGRVARDLIDRCLVYTRSRANGTPDSGHGLPVWLREAIDSWLEQQQGAPALRGARTETQSRWTVPSLSFDPELRRLHVVLPYQEVGEAGPRWSVTASGHEPCEYDATVPMWARSGPCQEHDLETPFHALQATLVRGGGGVILSRSLPALNESNPALFFSERTCRARMDGGFIEGDSWYVVHHESDDLTSDGNLTYVERMGAPAGWWGDFTVDHVCLAGGTSITIGGTTYQVAGQRPRASLVVTGALPPYLTPLDDAVLAFESALPQVFIPQSREGESRSYLSVWQLSVRNEAGEAVAASPEELGARFDRERHGWLVPIEKLIPREDVGAWELYVGGPIGQDFAARLHLLPDMTFHVPPDPSFAGKGFPVRCVSVETPAHIEVLEERDAARRSDRGWVLEDRNRNGRIPFTVRDPRSGRETSAGLLLPTVRWRWAVGERRAQFGDPVALSVSDLRQTPEPILEVESPKGARVSATLAAAGAGEPMARLPVEQGPRSRVRVRQLVDTLAASTHVYHRLQLELEQGDGSTQAATVASIVEAPNVDGLEARFEGDDLIMEWRQERLEGRLSASLQPLWRPWNEAVAAEVEQLPVCWWRARFTGMSSQPGRFRFRIWQDHAWTGEVELSARGLTVGGQDEISQFLRGLPMSPAGLLQRALAETSPGRAHLRSLAECCRETEGAAELLALFARVLEKRMDGAWASLAWSELEEPLGRTKADVLPFIEALARTPRGEVVVEFARQVGLSHWRSIWHARDRISSSVRASLWSLWPPLGAVLDLSSERPEAIERCRDYLIDPHRETHWQELQAVAGQVADGVTPVHTERGTLGLTPAGADACIARSLARIRVIRQDQNHSPKATQVHQHLRTSLESARSQTKQLLGYDPVAVRVPAGWERKDDWYLGLFPAMSLAFALRNRLGARGILPTTQGHADEARVREWLPELHARDLCFAELLVARSFPT